MKKMFLSAVTIGSLLVGASGCSEDACENGEQDGSEVGVDCGGDCSPCANSVTIDGTVHSSPNITVSLDNEFWTEYQDGNVDVDIYGLTLGLNYIIESEVLTVTFNNDDVDAECVHAGDYSTTHAAAYAMSAYGFASVSTVNLTSSEVYITNVVEGNQTITLTSCNPTTKKVSGNFNVTIEKAPGVTKNVSGSFTDLTYTQNF